MNKVYVR